MSTIALRNNTFLKSDTSRDLAPLDEAWLSASDSQRTIAAHRQALINTLLGFMSNRRTKAKAFIKLQNQHQLGKLPPNIVEAIAQATKKGQLPNRATFYRWIERYQSRGITGLLPEHKGRQRKIASWHGIAITLYNQPTQPGYAQVARELREEHGCNLSDSEVRGFLKALPSHLGQFSARRIGAGERRKTQFNYIHRTTENLDVGMLYQGDGHTIDVYVQHPVTGNIWRPELTVWIDVKSRYIVGWYLSEAESSISTIGALSHAIVSHDHLPDCLYIDNGSGFKSRIMSDEAVGFYNRFNIHVIFAQPGNPGAKGQVERFFGVMEQDFGKRFGAAYCGQDVAKEVSQKFVVKSKKDKSEVPTLQQWVDRFEHWLDLYHNRPHPEYPDTTPAKMWATLHKNPVYMEATAVFRPRIERKVNRSSVQLHNRHYKHKDLIHYNTKTVHVEYDLHDDRTVTVLTETGKIICCAELIHKKNHLPTSRVEEYKAKRLEGQLKRKQQHIDEIKARSRTPVTANEAVAELENLGNDPLAITVNQTPKIEDEIEIDLLKY